MNLRSALLGCSSGQLARIAAAWSLALDAGTLRRELVELVAARMIAGVTEEQAWSGLGEVERAVIGLLVRAGGRHEVDLLTRRLGRLAPGWPTMPIEQPRSSGLSPVCSIAACCIACSTPRSNDRESTSFCPMR